MPDKPTPHKDEAITEFIYKCWCESEPIVNAVDYSAFDDYIKQLDLLGELE
jgi:hypothetical protein